MTKLLREEICRGEVDRGVVSQAEGIAQIKRYKFESTCHVKRAEKFSMERAMGYVGWSSKSSGLILKE